MCVCFYLSQTLTTLILRENKISEIPAEIGNLTQLTALDLSHNFLQGLPEGRWVGEERGKGGAGREREKGETHIYTM